MSQNMQGQTNQLGTIRAKKCAELFDVSICTWWRWVRTGQAPKSIKIGPRVTVWKVSDVMAMLDQQPSEQ